MLGAYLGDKAWCRDKLVKRVRKALEPLSGIMALRDTRTIHTAQQLAQVLLRFCSNTTLTFFLRTMPPSVTQDAAREHDRLMEEALYTLVGGARHARRRAWRGRSHRARSMSQPARRERRASWHIVCMLPSILWSTAVNLTIVDQNRRAL